MLMTLGIAIFSLNLGNPLLKNVISIIDGPGCATMHHMISWMRALASQKMHAWQYAICVNLSERMGEGHYFGAEATKNRFDPHAYFRYVKGFVSPWLIRNDISLLGQS